MLAMKVVGVHVLEVQVVAVQVMGVQLWGAAGAWGAGCRCFIRVRVVLEVEELQVRWGVLHLLQRAVTWCQDSSRSQTRALQCCAGCGAARSQRNPMVPVALGI